MNELTFSDLRKRDYKKVIELAIRGMNFRWYLKGRLPLKMYGKYFLYLELSKASQVIACYQGEELAGLLLADMKGERKFKLSPLKRLYVRFIDFVQHAFVKGGVEPYDDANREMLESYERSNDPDGEICFLAANKDLGMKGIGTELLGELAKREKGKEVYLFTDTGCTYQFYEHRGFERAGQKDVVLVISGHRTDLTCLLFRKTL